MRYLALLRGINVGGNNIVKMSELRTCFECMGLEQVATYIQSGNVLFESTVRSVEQLSRAIEEALSAQLVRGAQVVVVPQRQLERVVKKAPIGFGMEPEKYRYDVIFIKAPSRAEDLLGTVPLKEGVDEAFESNGVLYFKRLISRASESKLPKLINTPGYKSMTVRNWNTTAKLYELMSE